MAETDNGSFTSRHVFYEEGLPKAVAQKRDDMTIEVTWEKSKFENNIAGYRIFESYNRFNYFNEVAYLEGGSANGYTFDEGRFAVETRFYIMQKPKKREIPFNSYDDLRFMGQFNKDIIMVTDAIFPFSAFVHLWKFMLLYRYLSGL